MTRSKKITIFILLALTLVLAGISVFLVYYTSQEETPDDVGVSAVCCGAGNCSNGAEFGADTNPNGVPQGNCQTRAEEFCSQFGPDVTVRNNGGTVSCDAPPGGGGGTGGGDVCVGGNDACQTVGQLVSIEGGSCICTRTEGTACNCVPTSGTTCAPIAFPSRFENNCSERAVGEIFTFMGEGSENGNQYRCVVTGGSNDGPICRPEEIVGSPGDNSPCEGETDCDEGYFCNGATNSCTRRKANGERCSNTVNRQCLSNFCNAEGRCASPSSGGTVDPGGKTIGDTCTPGENECGTSLSQQLSCISCGGGVNRCGYPEGGEVAVQAACNSPGNNTAQPIAACDGRPLNSIRCVDQNAPCPGCSVSGQICTENGWSENTVRADACGASCSVPGSIPDNRTCEGDAIQGSGFLGCGNIVPGGNGDSCSNCYRNNQGQVVCIREGTSCGANANCFGGGSSGGGGGSNPPPPNQNQVQVTGRVYCQDNGGPLYPIQGAQVLVVQGTSEEQLLSTNGNGQFSATFNRNASAGYGVRFQNLPNGTLGSTGQPFNAMTLRSDFCTPLNQLGCASDRVVCRTDGRYESCDIAPGNSANNFNFVFQNCAPAAPEFCGDGICQSGEFCEYAADQQSFVACAGNSAGLAAGTLVDNCRDLSQSPPGETVPPACTFCGDGVLNGGEQCDPNAPGTEGDNCNQSCEAVTPVCQSLESSFVGAISVGEGNTITYTLRYTNASEEDPLPNIGLIVGNNVGRDAYANSESIVQPATIENNPRFIPSTSTWIYTFVWEAADITGTPITPIEPLESYDVRIVTDRNDINSAIGTSACQLTQETSNSGENQPNFIITKTGTEVCTADNSARIVYTIVVENISNTAGVIDQVTDTLDQRFIVNNIVPSGISPVTGTYNNGVITWIDSEADRIFIPGQTRSYSYIVTIPNALLDQFYSTGVDNRARVEFLDNTLEFEVNVPITCQKIINPIPIDIPVTGLFDGEAGSANLILIGMFFALAGLLAYKMGVGQFALLSVVGLLQNNTGKGKYERKIMQRFGNKEED